LRGAKRRSNPCRRRALGMDCSHGGLPRQGSIRGMSAWLAPLMVCVRSVVRACVVRSGWFAGSTSHSVGAQSSGRAMIPFSTGEAREAVPVFAAAFEAKQSIGRRPGSAEADQASADGGGWRGSRGQAAFMTAPSMTTPALTNFHSATNSFRASATASRLRAAFPVMVGRRSRYQRASAESGW